MADQDDVRRIALALPETSEAEDRFELLVDGWRCQAPRALVDSFDRSTRS